MPDAWRRPDALLLCPVAGEITSALAPAFEAGCVGTVTQGWRGVTLLTRDRAQSVPTLPRPEVDPTGAGDVFAAAFLLGYHESGDPVEAAAFACCAASCAVEGVGTTALGDRLEVQRRIALRERFLEEGEWDD